MMPIFYTDNEGGDWLPWPFQEPMYQEDISTLVRHDNTIDIHGLRVHSLAFDDIKGDEFPRWDVINGWTRPLP